MRLNLKSSRSLYRLFVMLFITLIVGTGFIFWRLFSNYQDNIQPDVELASVFILLSLLTLISTVFFYQYTKTITIPKYHLKKAIKNKQFIPYIQPIIGGKNNEIMGCEILVRWQHPVHGLLAPNKFIAQIEKSDLIIPLTHHLITQVRDYFAPIAHQLPAHFHFNFNISAKHYKDIQLVDDCQNFLKSFPEGSVKLILEITERELLAPDDHTMHLFNKLNKLGVLIALDDFGTGYSNYNYLQKLNVNLIKIGHNFVSKMNTDVISKHIVENIVDLALRLHLEIVAEGVENQKQINQLKKYSVDYLQGYYFDRPMPLEEFVKKWL
ncbi:EAL domain-containing protein [Xenorhabdus sp. DI]|nr:EAL domain-containing protein [Xenorhabdus sp. 3]MBD2787356.1 EAL domain-containing protein [Xenorhabdus sp. DI]MBD2796656.1 EAL domain-containing protein [Xenorhabdus sp. 18]